ncbi:MAG: T9SS type A sorting domain-containing protein, partial [bacterium]
DVVLPDLTCAGDDLTCDSTLASATVTVNNPGDLGTLSYNWTPDPVSGDGTAHARYDAPGTYKVVVIDLDSGCKDSCEAVITEDVDIPDLTCAGDTLTCDSVLASATVTVNNPGDLGTLSYDWTPYPVTGQGTAHARYNAPGTKRVVVTDVDSGCKDSCEATIIEDADLPDLTCTGGNAPCDTSLAPPACANVTVNNLGALGTVTYFWSPAPLDGQGTNHVHYYTPGVKKVVVTDTDTGCKDSCDAVITDTTIIPDLTCEGDTLTCDSLLASATVTVNNPGDLGTLMYVWSPAPVSGQGSAHARYDALGTKTVVVTDLDTGCKDSCQAFVYEVTCDTCCPVIAIEKTHLTIQGQHEYVDVTVDSGGCCFEWGGFDFLIVYDRSALNFQSVLPGHLFDLCDWEYFTYRTWFWPSYEPHFFWGGVIRVVAIADLNNGANHPSCFCLTGPFVLFTVDFIVTDNRLFECQYAPIAFFWTDCNDNAISSVTGDTLWVSRFIYGFDRVGEISDPNTGFPTYTGVQSECLIGGGEGKPAPIQCIDFISGGVDIACADSLDDRGDINLNGVAYEIADAVVFTNYFVYGFSAFSINLNGQIAASDCNSDGLALTVGDLVYLIRVVVGDALPYSKLASVEATYRVDNGVVSVNSRMGAALVVIEGQATPTLLANGMEMKYNYDREADVTRTLVYSLEGNDFSGQFLDAGGSVVSIELGSYQGAVVRAVEAPVEFALHHNYPNPFNPTTTISFSLPAASDYTLTIYNVTGQEVTEFSERAEAGLVTVEWDASELASGVYFYRLRAGDRSATKKMLLLK